VKACREEYRPRQNLAVDEAMVAFKGQLSIIEAICSIKANKKGY